GSMLYTSMRRIASASHGRCVDVSPYRTARAARRRHGECLSVSMDDRGRGQGASCGFAG
ncbi:hypothetical protein HAX54_018372, partial [Datura stramonium]|nr:hypothetical protein [Datura stramonium]